MQVFTEKKLLQNYLKSFNTKDISVGFVPTMGALHKGHLSLVSVSLKENDITIVSIFVNPTQFNNLEDLDKYPKNLANDLELLKKHHCDIVFTPSVSEMYNQNITADSFDFGGLENRMEGAHREGHFNGVGTIVKKLFNMVKPTKAYFGEKDFQQLQIIKKLVEIENLPIKIVGCPIYREKNGLAMSSRNQRLTKKQREEASFIFTTLQLAKNNYPKKTLEAIKETVKNRFLNHHSLSLEYFTIADEETLQSITKKNQSKRPRAFIAAFLNSVRLIDNIALYN